MGLYHLLYGDVMGTIIKKDFESKFGRNAFNCTCEMWEFAEFVQVIQKKNTHRVNGNAP